MPQVAQQDYLRIAPKIGRGGIQGDAAALVRIKQLMQRGTILDAAITTGFEGDTKDTGEIGRVFGFYKRQTVYLYDGLNGEIMHINVPYSVEQYEGLSAVQLAIDEYTHGPEQGLPQLTTQDQSLMEDNDSIFICVDGYKLDVDTNEGKLMRLSISQNKPDPDNDDFVNITWEDAQKLIGLPIA